MTQNLKSVWNREYEARRFMSGKKPLKSVVNFAKFLKKDMELRGKDLPFEGLKVLDLGSGEGKNTAYFAERGAKVYAIEISSVAHVQAKKLYANLNIEFINDSFSKKLKFEDGFFDIVLDVTSSNSLTERERKIYIKEVARTLKPGGYFFVRALLLDGDKNAKRLLKEHPGSEAGTYILPEVGLQEKVFSSKEFKELYSKYFKIVKMEKETHYSKFSGRSFKRNFLIAYMQKLEG